MFSYSSKIDSNKTKAVSEKALRASDAPGALVSPQNVMQLQRTIGNSAVLQLMKKNNTGMPDSLKGGIEGLSGLSMDDVKVHYNSHKPSQLQALAYAQGSDIHVGPGQEQHLPHEAWHAVQQMQGRVKPTLQMKGQVNVNDDSSLEQEAEEMSRKTKGYKD